MVELGLAVAREGLVGGEIHLATEDGLDDQRRLELVDIALLVPHREVLHVLLVTARIGLLIGALELVATALLQEGLVVAPDLVLGRAVVHGVAGEAELGDTVHVMATAGMPSSTARDTMSLMRVAPSSME